MRIAYTGSLQFLYTLATETFLMVIDFGSLAEKNNVTVNRLWGYESGNEPFAVVSIISSLIYLIVKVLAI